MARYSPLQIFRRKNQATVALSSAEAEYMAPAAATQEALWVRHLLEEMGLQLKAAILVCIDSKSAISMATSSGYTPRAKHIDLRYHFVRDHVTRGDIVLQHVPSALQIADFLAKPLPTPQLVKLIALSGMAASWGGVLNELNQVHTVLLWCDMTGKGNLLMKSVRWNVDHRSF